MTYERAILIKIKKAGINCRLVVFMIVVLNIDINPLTAQSVLVNHSGIEDLQMGDHSHDTFAKDSPGRIYDEKSWPMHQIDSMPSSGSDGVKLADVNGDEWPDLVTGFEEGDVSRIYIHPGPDNVRQYWDYVELPSPDVEDAVLVDLDSNGMLDLVTASEGSTNCIMFHWAPEDPEDYLEASKWQTKTVPVANGLSAWMFIVPVDLGGQKGVDLILGSKRKRGEKGDDRAVVGWLMSPENPRDIDKWEYFPLAKAGWIMSIEIMDMNGNHRPDILISDRKFSTQTGVRWLENPGPDQENFYREWKSHMIGVEDGEPMFLTITDLNKDGVDEIVVPDLYAGLMIFELSRNRDKGWKEYTVPYPGWAGPRGKSVSAGDINLDGRTDLVLSFEEEGKMASLPYEQYSVKGKYSVIWGYFQDDPFSEDWNFNKISGLKGRKFDLVTLIDIDGDGDLDVLTNDENEEGGGLGIIWYENLEVMETGRIN